MNIDTRLDDTTRLNDSVGGQAARKRGRPALDGSKNLKNRRDDIIKASTLLFFQEGYAGTTLRCVAARADVNVALIHYYFTSKQGLYQEVLSNAFAETLTALRKYQRIAPALPHLVQVMAAPLLAHPALARRFLFPDGPAEAVTTLSETRHRIRVHLLMVLQKMQRTGLVRRDMDADLLTSTFLDLCWGPIRQLYERENERNVDTEAETARQISQNTKVLEVAIQPQATNAF